jgi:CRP-like cAMP-binding protein
MSAVGLANGTQAALARIPLFAGIAPGAVEHLERFMARFEIASGQRLFRQGDHGGRLHVIEHGRLELQAELTAGQTRVLAELGPGQLLGETSLLGGGKRTATAVAREPTSGWVLDRAGFEMLRLDVSPGAVEFTARMAGLAVARLRARYQRIAAELGGDGGLCRAVRTRGCCPGCPGAGGSGVSAGTAVLPGVPRPRADRGGDRRRAPGRGPARSGRGRGG